MRGVQSRYTHQKYSKKTPSGTRDTSVGKGQSNLSSAKKGKGEARRDALEEDYSDASDSSAGNTPVVRAGRVIASSSLETLERAQHDAHTGQTKLRRYKRDIQRLEALVATEPERRRRHQLHASLKLAQSKLGSAETKQMLLEVNVNSAKSLADSSNRNRATGNKKRAAPDSDEPVPQKARCGNGGSNGKGGAKEQVPKAPKHVTLADLELMSEADVAALNETILAELVAAADVEKQQS